MKTLLIYFVLTLLLIICNLYALKSQNIFPFDNNFLKMEGMLLKHPLRHSPNTLTDNEILELQDEVGMTIWFSRFFYKDICISDICRMAKFWIYWDISGNYLGYRLNENEPLTKSNHVDFDLVDYLRLNEILQDKNSVLQDLKYEDLTTSDEITEIERMYGVDGYSEATNKALSEHVIKNAAFTCYTLWHTVYGETLSEIKNILNKRINSNYVAKLLNGNNIQNSFAIEIAKNNPEYFIEYKSQYLNLLASNDKELSNSALSLISREYLVNPKNQLEISEYIEKVNGEIRREIFNKLRSTRNLSDNVIILLLDKYNADLLNFNDLVQIYRLFNSNTIHNKEIEDRLKILSNSSDTHVSKLTKGILE